jgi:tRNA (guanine-N7-)-methyltransferase
MQNKLIRSYGRRKARKLRDTSQKAYEELLPLLKLDPTQKPFTPDLPEVWLEIGFGGGEHMLEQLAHNSDISMIGCEPFMNGVAKLLTHLLPKDYPRVKVWHEDVRLLLETTPPSYFNRAFILFPDPWPKKRHHVRRLITKDFMDQLYPTLKEGAFLHVASDDVAYVEQIQEVLYHYPGLKLCLGPASADPSTWEPRPEGWPATRYEQKALAKGKPCAYMIFQKESLPSL